MSGVCMRLLGLVLLLLSPVAAAWALYAFRNSDIPEDHSYLFNLRKLVEESWNLTWTGDVFGNEEG